MTSTQLTFEEVYELLSDVSERDVTHITMPTGEALWLQFRVTDGLDTTLYTFEVNLHSGSLWLHESTGDGKETVWKNKRRR